MHKLFAAALACAALLGSSCSEEAADTPPPNVILITMDTTRADYLSCYGYHRETTPHMDKLASEGVMFTRAMSTSAVTPVSHASILTGLYQFEHGVRVIAGDAGFKLPSSTQSFATVLKKRGYKLAAVHSAFPVSDFYGFDQGFDVFESFEGEMLVVEQPVFDKKTGKRVLDPKTGEPLKQELSVWNVSEGTRRSEATTDVALKFLDTATEPFFLWIHYWDAHDANDSPPDEFLDDQYLIRERGGRYRRTDDFYAEEVRFVDSQLGRLFAGLRERGLYDNSLIILTADHGDGLSDGDEIHGWKAHRELYVEQLNVPLIYKFPVGTEGVELGASVDQVVGTIDILPTACDYLDFALASPVSGYSLRGLIDGSGSKPRILYADQINGFDKNAAMTQKRPKARFIYSVISDDWKLIYRPVEEHPKELYHIATDPRERANVAEANPAVVDELMLKLANLGGWVTVPFRASDGTTTSIDLGKLGYAEAAGEYAGAFEWTCPIGHERREKQRGECAECGNPLVPIAAPVVVVEDAKGEPENE